MAMLRCGEEWGPAVVMLLIDAAYGVINSLIKKSLDQGLNELVLVTLRQLMATAFLAPIAYFRERKTRPKLTGKIFSYIFLSALLGGSLLQYLFFLGMQYTNATFACAFLNMTPVFTFLVAILFRMETVDLKKIVGKFKILATLVCLTGTIVLMFYRGRALTHASSASAHAHAHTPLSGYSPIRWTIGSLILFVSSFSWSGWFLVQSKLTQQYPVIYSMSAMMFFLSSLQSAVLGLAIERDISLWLVKGKLEIITIISAGVVGSGVGYIAMTWCVLKRGPVFTSAFSPLIQIVVAIIDFTYLQEPLYLGSVLGSVLVILGLYLLLWAKNKENLMMRAKTVEGGNSLNVAGAGAGSTSRGSGQVEPV